MVRGRRNKGGSSSEESTGTPPEITLGLTSNSNQASVGQQPSTSHAVGDDLVTVADETLGATGFTARCDDQDKRLDRIESLLEGIASKPRRKSRAGRSGSRRKHQSPPPARLSRPSSRLPRSRPRYEPRSRSSSETSVSSMSSVSRSRSPIKSKPYKQENFLGRHDVVDSFDKLVLVNVRTLNILVEKGESVKNIQGVLDHLELLCTKAATKVFQTRALIEYDRAVRARANTSGLVAFRKVLNSDVLKYFSYDSSVNAITKQTKTKVSSKNGSSDVQRPCFAFNKAESSCVASSCKYKHACMFCRSPSHGASECKTESKAGPSK